MEYFFAYLLILFGFIFIVSQLYPDSLLSKSYDGVICEIDEDSKTIVVQYEKKGEKCKAAFCLGNFFSDSIFGDDFHYYIGMEVNIILNENNKIKLLIFRKVKMKKERLQREFCGLACLCLDLGCWNLFYYYLMCNSCLVNFT